MSTVRRQEVEAQVLRATEELLGEGASFGDLNVERIATRAGIGRTAFYFYFRDKRELLLRLTADVTELLYTEADGWYSGRTEMDEALRKISALYEEHGPLLRAIVQLSAADEEVAGFWRSLIGRFIDATQQRIAADRPDLPARATAFALVWMTERSYYEQLVQDGPIGREELVEALVGVWGATLG